MEPSQLIDQRIAETQDWRGERMAHLRQWIHEADPEITEDWKWDTPIFVRGGNICGLGCFKDHVKLHFFKGASLPDPDGLFNAGLDAKAMRAIDFMEGDQVDERAFKALIAAGAALNLS